jgi:hypothetical protein
MTTVTTPMMGFNGDRDVASNRLSYITSYFTSNEPQPQYKTNESWNNPINDNSEGLFRVYYQNIHGILREDVMLDQDLHQGGNFWNQNDSFLSRNDCESKRSFFDMVSEICCKFANLFQICRLRSNLKSPSRVCDSRSRL